VCGKQDRGAAGPRRTRLKKLWIDFVGVMEERDPAMPGARVNKGHPLALRVAIGGVGDKRRKL